ncbi:hypothetical protein LMG26696_03330 [Achromobacter pulmonis]|uniref:surface-adhesin E family protein n=1 Tax=Achromobacter pulmonis TaxID=1389932 RepID=UPI001465833D|nr:hypothetical protein [Achromobacter pulmonis]CAB3660199.1 hypothetical protein LMG26696_03330 [Achromobacter pulmonis]
MKFQLLVVAALLGSSAHAAGWQYITPDHKAAGQFDVDLTSRYGRFATAWAKFEYATAQTLPRTGKAYDLVLTRFLFDCESGRGGVMQNRMYLRGQEQEVLAIPFDVVRSSMLNGLPAASPIQLLMNTACRRPSQPGEPQIE